MALSKHNCDDDLLGRARCGAMILRYTSAGLTRVHDLEDQPGAVLVLGVESRAAGWGL